jgi:hypothetical protein
MGLRESANLNIDTSAPNIKSGFRSQASGKQPNSLTRLMVRSAVGG